MRQEAPEQTRRDADVRSSDTIRVAIADAQGLSVAAVLGALDAAADIRVVGRAASGADAPRLLRALDPDVLIVDPAGAESERFAILARLRRERPRTRIIVLTAHDDPRSVSVALDAGATAYVLKSVNPVDLPSVVRQAVDRSVHLPPPPRPPEAVALSTRERQVLELLVEGRSNAEIARRLDSTHATVKFHVATVLRKFGVRNRTQVAAAVLRRSDARAPARESPSRPVPSTTGVQ
jgi:DNA-binding NarL/FixJ family response regulator